MHKIRFILLVCFILANNSIYSQDWNKIMSYEFDAENFMADKQFEKAAETFKKASKQVPENLNFKFKIGFCYLNTDDKKNLAIQYLEQATKSVSKDYSEQSLKEPNAPTKTYYLLAEAYRINRQYDKAVEAYNKFKEYLKPNDKLRALVDNDIASCSNAEIIIKDSVSVKITNLGNTINNDAPNINAVVSGDGKTLAYTNIAKTGNDIFVVNRSSNGNWSLPKKITTQLGNKYLLTSFLSYDGKDLYLTSDDPENCDIYVTTIEKNKWVKVMQFEKPINTKSNETHVCLTKDGNTIYFTSDRKGGLGGFDIYKSNVNEKGVWGEPVNLGSEINTPFNEATPFLSPDEKYLFFSSEGHNGMGGFDIFYVNLIGNPKVENLGYPVNNSDNNLFYFPENGFKSGFMSFYEKNSNFGRRDIYHLDISRYTNLNGNILADANDFIVRIFDVDKNDTIAKLESVNGKSFSYKVGKGNYKVIVKNSKYLPFSNDISIPDDYPSKEFSFDAKMVPIPIETPKLIAEVKKDTATIKQPKVIAVTETPKTITKPIIKETKKTEEVKQKIVPVIKIENSNNSSSTAKISIYAVQLMALKVDVGDTYFKNLENIEITQTATGFFRYSVGSTESMDEAMATLKKVKALGYEKAFVRIDRINAIYTIQLVAQKTPVDLNSFKNVEGVIESKSADGYYRYSVGSFSSPEDAKTSLNSIIESGYKSAFIKKIADK